MSFHNVCNTLEFKVNCTTCVLQSGVQKCYCTTCWHAEVWFYVMFMPFGFVGSRFRMCIRLWSSEVSFYNMFLHL